MKTKCLAMGISTVSVILLILASLTNVIGYQTVQSSHQQTINEEVNQKELLFQTIVDIANNKEIQGIILKSQMSRGIFPTSEFPVVTKNQLKMMYFLGLILSKVISKSRIQSLIGKYQFNNQEMQKEISSVIEKDTIINSEITLLKDSECDCEKNEPPTRPILCGLLSPLHSILDVLSHISIISAFFNDMLDVIGLFLGCSWAPGVPPE
jgi:hypothetical protein